MRGRSIRLSPARKIVTDLTHFSVPSVPVQRVMRLQPVVEARAACADRPAWTAIFTKAFALVAEQQPDLRRAYIKLPTPRLYEYPVSVAQVAVERDLDGEVVVLIAFLVDPANMPLMEVNRRIRQGKTEPIADNKAFKRLLAIGRLPLPIRRLAWWVGLNIGRQRGNYFGTFGVSVYSELGAESLHPVSPLTAVVNYGVIGEDGTVTVRIMYDHRVLDGSNVARHLARLEETLTGPIVDELKVLAGDVALSG
jgi:hypothetical protein